MKINWRFLHPGELDDLPLAPPEPGDVDVEDDDDISEYLQDEETDDDGEVVEDAPSGVPERTVGQATLQDAMEVLQASGYVAVPQSLVTEEQAAIAPQAIDYASMVEVPQEVYDQGPEAEANYRAMMAAQAAIQGQFAPMFNQNQAAAIASNVNRPDLADAINQAMTEQFGPQWYMASQDPQLSGMFSLMVKGIMADNPLPREDQVKIPNQVIAGRKAPAPIPPADPRASNPELQRTAQKLGMTVEELLADDED